MLIILATLTLVGVVALVLINHFTNEVDPNAEPTIDEVIALSYDTEEIMTNLLSNDFIRATFKIQVDNKNALEEIEKRDFQINNVILRSLSGKKASELAGPDGMEDFQSSLKEELNGLMTEGSVVQVYTTSWIIQ